MSHAMRSTLQSQNVLVELTHKLAHTCLDLSQIPPASDGLPLIVTTPTVLKGAIPWLFHQLVYMAQTIGIVSVFWERTTPKRRCHLAWHRPGHRPADCFDLKGSPPIQIGTFKPAGVQSNLTVPECWAKFKPVFALSHCLRPPSHMVPSSSNDNPTM